MKEIAITSLDFAKNVRRAHGSDVSEVPVLKKRLRRDQVLPFFAGHPPCPWRWRHAHEPMPGRGRLQVSATRRTSFPRPM